MKHLMMYEGYTTNQRKDDILDKISKYGISSLSKMEKEFLDSFSKGEENETHDRISKEESGKVFEEGYFKFEYEETEDYGDELHHKGILYVPDLVFEDGKKIEGRLEGRLIVYKNGETSPEFYSAEDKDYEIFDFCNGLEYELDSFFDDIIYSLKEMNS